MSPETLASDTLVARPSLWHRIRTPFRWMRRHPKSTVAGFVTLFFAWAVYGVTRPAQPTYVTAAAERGTLRQTVEAVGTVVSEKDLELQFPSTDVVAQVLVKEGDHVKAGQKLASLRSGTLSASVASASASVQSAEAALRALEEGSRPEDIAIAEANVANKRASLQVSQQALKSAEDNLSIAQSKLLTLQTEANIGLSGEISTAASTIAQQLAISKTAIQAAQGVFNANDVSDAVVKSSPAGYDTVQANMSTTLTDLSVAQMNPAPTAYKDALLQYQKARSLVATTANIMNRAYDILSGLPQTAYFTNTSQETNKATLATQKSYVQSALSTLDASMQSLQDASATYDTRIATQQAEVVSLQGTRDKAKADIFTYETSLRIEEAQLALKKAPARQTDIDAARARVRQAQADLARAAAQVRDTLLTAPVDGIVTKVNVKVGQIRPTTEPSITMLGVSPYRIEMFASEVDIPKVRLGQSGSIVLDAFRDTPFELVVGEIDAAATDKDGVPKYRVKMDFLKPVDTLKVGMTGDAEVTTGIRQDVVSVPLRAVIERDDGTHYVRVLNADGKTFEEHTVTTGIEGEGGSVEVTGVQEGEMVIVLIKQ
jgi:RND family efflux transporter MFP subunit